MIAPVEEPNSASFVKVAPDVTYTVCLIPPVFVIVALSYMYVEPVPEISWERLPVPYKCNPPAFETPLVIPVAPAYTLPPSLIVKSALILPWLYTVNVPPLFTLTVFWVIALVLLEIISTAELIFVVPLPETGPFRVDFFPVKFNVPSFFIPAIAFALLKITPFRFTVEPSEALITEPSEFTAFVKFISLIFNVVPDVRTNPV